MLNVRRHLLELEEDMFLQFRTHFATTISNFIRNEGTVSESVPVAAITPPPHFTDEVI